ncbi:ABC transporter ATP-binding protein [Nitritalea halalkaliphila]|uniref:ABC transporter ATP-binding protein n=1 Tax=Nitritalea halalkaliphila TaxID=590849 RepID=UPI0002EF2D1C|nr:ATP-binding cassette domain-containing protein [Nitritalea halalkaliphila]
MQYAWNKFLEVSGSLVNLQDFQNSLKVNQEYSGKLDFSNLKNEINVKNVSFSYGENGILNNINLSIPKNKSVAFVGESGSGKTTLVNLLCGLIPPTSGQILIDDLNLNELNKLQFQQRIGYITQEPVIFNDTIFNNITFWAKRTPENEMRCIEALKKASVYEFVYAQAGKLDTVLGNNGINLSGGQRQRISIARELYKEIDILIMDEATSALDSETERAIQENIDALKGQYTLLTVAHRLSTIRNADTIVLLERGAIKEQGNFSELLERVPKFKKMVQLQEV